MARQRITRTSAAPLRWQAFGTTPAETYSQIIHVSSPILNSQISLSGPLASVTHRDDIRCVLLAEGVNRWRLLAEWDVAPEGSASSAKPPEASGDIARLNYMDPSSNGLVEQRHEREKNPAG